MNPWIPALLLVCLAGASSLVASPIPTVESRGAFVKIATGPGSVDIPVELNPPQLLYLRKSSILRIAVTYVARNTDFEATITVYGGELAPRAGAAPAGSASLSADAIKIYYYHFTNPQAAAEFCEAVLANQEG